MAIFPQAPFRQKMARRLLKIRPVDAQQAEQETKGHLTRKTINPEFGDFETRYAVGIVICGVVKRAVD
jgi:hypothetical protein